MIEQGIFKVDTRGISAHLMLRLGSMGITATLQNVGGFLDAARNEIAQVSAHYYLARISSGKSISMDAVYLQIHRMVTQQMCKHIPSMTPDQIEKAKVAVLQTIASVFTQQYNAGVGDWDNCTLVSLTPSEYIVNASRKRVNVPQAANPDNIGLTNKARMFAGDHRWAF